MGLKVKLVKSLEGSNERQRATVAGLGLWRLNQERVLEDTKSVRGMLFKVQHLVKSETVDAAPEKRQRMKPRKVRAKEAARAKKAAAAK